MLKNFWAWLTPKTYHTIMNLYAITEMDSVLFQALSRKRNWTEKLCWNFSLQFFVAEQLLAMREVLYELSGD